MAETVQGFSVEESRTKRVERLQSKYRDRGGVFKPATHNALLDILLARGVDGESPSKRRKSRKSFAPPRDSASPTTDWRKPVNPAPAKKEAETVAEEPPSPIATKGRAKAEPKKRKRQTKAKRESTATEPRRPAEDEREDAKPVAGPSCATKPLRRAVKYKAKQDSEMDDNGMEEVSDKVVKRAPSTKAKKVVKKAKASDGEDDDASPPNRVTRRRSRPAVDSEDRNPDSELHVPPKRAKPTSKRPAKAPHTDRQQLEPVPEESDNEDDVPLFELAKKNKKRAEVKKDISNMATAGLLRRVSSRATDMALATVQSSHGGTHLDDSTLPPAASKRSGANIVRGSEYDVRNDNHTASASPSQSTSGPDKRVGSARQELPKLNQDSGSSDGPVTAKRKKGAPVWTRTAQTIQAKAQDDDSGSLSAVSRQLGKIKVQPATVQATAEEDPVIGQGKTSKGSKKRGRSKQIEATPPEEDVHEDDEQPRPPRKRSKHVGDTTSTVLTEVVQPEDAKKGKPASKVKSSARTKKAAEAQSEHLQRPKPLKENAPAAPRTAHQKANNRGQRKPKPRLSMLPPPALAADSDDDPIDFLS